MPSADGMTTVRSVAPPSSDSQAVGRVVCASTKAVPTATTFFPDFVTALAWRTPRSSPSSTTSPPGSRRLNLLPTPSTDPSGPATAPAAASPPPRQPLPAPTTSGPAPPLPGAGSIFSCVQSAFPVQFAATSR